MHVQAVSPGAAVPTATRARPAALAATTAAACVAPRLLWAVRAQVQWAAHAADLWEALVEVLWAALMEAATAGEDNLLPHTSSDIGLAIPKPVTQPSRGRKAETFERVAGFFVFL